MHKLVVSLEKVMECHERNLNNNGKLLIDFATLISSKLPTHFFYTGIQKFIWNARDTFCIIHYVLVNSELTYFMLGLQGIP